MLTYKQIFALYALNIKFNITNRGTIKRHEFVRFFENVALDCFDPIKNIYWINIDHVFMASKTIQLKFSIYSLKLNYLLLMAFSLRNPDLYALQTAETSPKRSGIMNTVAEFDDSDFLSPRHTLEIFHSCYQSSKNLS